MVVQHVDERAPELERRRESARVIPVREHRPLVLETMVETLC
jgi:hypothetical protein